MALYAVRALPAQAAVERELDSDRLSFTEGLCELTEMISLALINPGEVKQIYNKYKPKKRQVPPPQPFKPEEQFLDFVDLLDPLASELPVGGP